MLHRLRALPRPLPRTRQRHPTPPQIRLMDEPDLPELHESILDDDTVRDLVRDVSSLTKILEVIPKGGSEDYVAKNGKLNSVDIELGRDLLLARQIRGLQIRYEHQGSQWWDTLIALPDGFKIVRIEHNFEQQEI